ncbi:MAG: hypothetical protein QNJ60_09840 [Xenococcaceae cyanobacterium MO_188.B19]|nr:hypothetical protein [Xenococcaceae cyanobacterium MO_188.B19]
MPKAQQKTKTETKSKTEPPQKIPFLNGKKLRKADNYPPETIFLYEVDYKKLMEEKKKTKNVPPSRLDEAARNIVKYRKLHAEAIRERQMDDLLSQADKIVFGLKTPRRVKRKIKTREDFYRLVPFRNGYIARTKKNHRPGTIFITLGEYNALMEGYEKGEVPGYLLDDVARNLIGRREPDDIEAIAEYQRKNPPPEPKPKKKKKAEDSRLFPVVNDKRIWDSEIKNYKPEEILWLTGKELNIVWEADFGRKGFQALLEVVKNYKLPLVDGRRIPKSKISEYPAEKVEYVRMKAYIEDKMPIPSVEEVITQQESNIKALAKDIAQETAQRFVKEIIPESLSRHLSPEQIEVQKQDFAYGLSESLKKQLYWELSQARVEAKNR